MVESDGESKSAGVDGTDKATRPHDYVADIGFDQFDISPALRRAIAERGYLHPTQVQATTFEPIRQGRDLIVRSKTGTGKTAAFGIPLLERLPDGERKVRVLILCPTRELALQVATEISDLGKYRDLKVTAIYGGASMKTQETALSIGSAIIVGTPGRIYDHIRRKNLDLKACDCVVLDEADEMLNQGFYEEVTRILDCLPAKKQVLLFSATVPPDIEHLINRYASDPEALLLSGDVLTVEHIHHVRYDLSDAFPKPRNLIYMLELEEPENAIIFCNTKDDTALVTAVLNRNGFDAELLNGDLPQRERERVMAKVKGGEVAFMVATDIAARGIDISDLSHVINYSLPEDPAVYLHRVGRTGRIGKKGIALNLVSGRELTTLTALEKRYGIVFEKRPMPSPEEAIRLWTERHVGEIRESSAGTVYEGLLSLASQLRQRADADDLVAFLLKYFFTHHRMEKLSAAQQETPSQASAEETRPHARSRRNHRAAERPKRDSRQERRRSHSKPAAEGEAASRSEGGSEPREPLLWINLGKSDGLDAAGLTAAVESAGAPLGKVRRVSLRATYSYLAVAEEDAAGFEALTGRMHGEKALRVERAKKRR
ncbi:MAG TPA: DEAD/DEAH box helicase [Myxococcaceae bacterium]|nr:DEAD/DEAH box helicase [Myxococcaceae bacterium]